MDFQSILTKHNVDPNKLTLTPTTGATPESTSFDAEFNEYLSSGNLEQKEQKKPGMIKQSFEERTQSVADIAGSGMSGGSKALQQVGQGAGFVGDVLGAAVIKAGQAVLPKAAEKAVSDFATSIAGKVSETEVADAYRNFKATNPELAGNIEAVVNIAGLIPTGAAGSVAAKGATRGAVKGAQVAAKTVDAAASAGSGVAKRLGREVYGLSIRPGVDEAALSQKFEAATPLKTRVASTLKGVETPGAPRTTVKTGLDYGLMGNRKIIGVQAERAAKDIYKKDLLPKLKESNEVITVNELFSTADDVIAREPDITRKTSLQNALDSIKEDYAASGKTEFTLEEAENLKQSLNARTPNKLFKGQDVTESAGKLRKAMGDAIRQKIYKALGPGTREKYLDYGNLNQLKGIGVKARTKGLLSDGGTFTGISNIAQAVVTPVSTIGGRILYKIGDGLEFVAKKGKKYEFAEDVIEDFLKTTKGEKALAGAAAVKETVDEVK